MYLSKIVHGFKSSVTRMARKQWKNYSFGWQKSFYDHVIRDDEDLHRVRTYIQNNPLNWELDEDNPDNSSIKGPQGFKAFLIGKQGKLGE